MITTIETRLKLNLIQETEINACIILWSQYYRIVWKLFNNHKKSETEIYHYIMGLNLFTSNQVLSLINKVKTEHNKLKELTKTQLKQQQSKIDKVQKFIATENKKIVQYKKEIIVLKKAKKLNYAKISQLTISVAKKEKVIQGKSIKIKRLNKLIRIKQLRIETNTFKLCFGSTILLSQRPGNYKDKYRLLKSQQAYQDFELNLWKIDWDLARNNILFSIVDKKKPCGNAEIQYNPTDNYLRLRLNEKQSYQRLKNIAKELNIPIKDLDNNEIIKYGKYRLQSKYITIPNIEFCPKYQIKIQQAINNKQPVTAKIIKKLTPNQEIGFYLQLSFEEKVNANLNIHEIKNTLNKASNSTNHLNNNLINNTLTFTNLTMGIDLNQKGLAYTIIQSDGNKLSNQHAIKINSNTNTNTIQRHKLIQPCGFIHWNLESKTSNQREWIISNTITQLLNIAQQFKVKNIAIENLDFSSTIHNMNTGYKSKTSTKGFNYNKMLTQFAKKQFSESMQRKTERLELKLYLVNPTYSSVGGFTKYGLYNNLPVDVSASLWLARQSLYGKKFKSENHVEFIKKHDEEIVFPYLDLSKQSKRLILSKVQWKTVSSALGKNRSLWKKNLLAFIQGLKVGQSHNLEEDFNPFGFQVAS